MPRVAHTQHLTSHVLDPRRTGPTPNTGMNHCPNRIIQLHLRCTRLHASFLPARHHEIHLRTGQLVARDRVHQIECTPRCFKPPFGTIELPNLWLRISHHTPPSQILHYYLYRHVRKHASNTELSVSRLSLNLKEGICCSLRHVDNGT